MKPKFLLLPLACAFLSACADGSLRLPFGEPSASPPEAWARPASPPRVRHHHRRHAVPMPKADPRRVADPDYVPPPVITSPAILRQP